MLAVAWEEHALINSTLRFFSFHSTLASSPNPVQVRQVEGSEMGRVLRETLSHSGFLLLYSTSCVQHTSSLLIIQALVLQVFSEAFGGVQRKGNKSFYLGGCIHQESGLASGCSCTSAFPFVLLSLAWLLSSASKPSPLLLSFREESNF